jgi:NAD(P) transhydrogenase subunit beta
MPMLDIPQTIPTPYAIGIAAVVVSYILMYGLWRMSVTATSAYGLRLTGAAMLAAVLAGCLCVAGLDATAAPRLSVNLGLAAIALTLGGGAAWWRVQRADAAALPQLTALFNGLGAAAVAIIASIEIFLHPTQGLADLVLGLAAMLLAAISFASSLISWAKLRGGINYTLRLRGRGALMGALLIAAGTLIVYLACSAAGEVVPFMDPSRMSGLLVGCGVLCGILMALPLDARDVPIAVSMNNAISGLAVALVGLLLRMPEVTIVGMLIAGAGLSITHRLVSAMNRSAGNTRSNDVSKGSGKMRQLDVSDAAIFMRYARKIVVVPGYGMAAAQAQNKLYEFMKLLILAGVDVKAAVHPLAGRIPGQMAAILAEAGVPEQLILSPSDVDEGFRNADVVLVIGANDVVNSMASTIKSLPVFGMPALNAGIARKVYVIKRGVGAGYAGIENQLFAGENCNMIYGDAQTVLIRMVEALRVAEMPIAA